MLQIEKHAYADIDLRSSTLIDKPQFANMTEPSPPRLVDLTLDDSDTSSDQKRATPYGHNTPVKHGVTNKRELTTEHEVTSPGMKYNIRTLFSAAEEAKERAAKNEIIRAQEQDIKDREKERQLGDKLSAKREPKEFIKSSKPREKKAFMDEMMSDSSSYLQEIITPEEQAKREVNFIGDAFYYNLTKSVVRNTTLAYETRTNISIGAARPCRRLCHRVHSPGGFKV